MNNVENPNLSAGGGPSAPIAWEVAGREPPKGREGVVKAALAPQQGSCPKHLT